MYWLRCASYYIQVSDEFKEGLRLSGIHQTTASVPIFTVPAAYFTLTFRLLPASSR